MLSFGGPRAERTWSWRRLLRWEPTVVGLAAVAVVVRLPRRWTPLGDNALIEIWVRAVGGRATPLVGGDARFGWNHLGPWVFYLLAVPYRLFGASAVGLLIGAALINVVSFAAIVRCVRTVAGRGASAVVALGALIFLITATGDRLIDPWNPYVVQMPFLLALVSCWAVINRHWGWCAWLVGAGSLCVQSYIAFGVPVFVLVTFSAVAVVRAKWSDVRRSVWRSAVVAVIAWLPVSVDLVLPHRHNVYRVARFFAHSSPTPTSGIRTGLGVVLRETGLRSSWLGGRLGLRLFTEGFDGGVGKLPGVGIGLLVLSGFIAYRRRDRVSGSMVALLSVLLVAAVAEMAQARGQVYPYLFGWVTLVGMMCWVIALVGVLRARCWSLVSRISGFVPMAGVVVLIVSGTGAGAPLSPRERPGDAAIVRSLVGQVEARLSRGQRYRLRHGTDDFSSIYEHGVVNALRVDGYQIVVDPNAFVLFGRQMLDAHAERYPTIAIVAPYESTLPDNELIAISDPLTPAERAEEAGLVGTLTAAYDDAGSRVAADIVRTADGSLVLIAGFVDPDPTLDPLLQRLATLRAKGRSIAVELGPSGCANGTCSDSVTNRVEPLPTRRLVTRERTRVLTDIYHPFVMPGSNIRTFATRSPRQNRGGQVFSAGGTDVTATHAQRVDTGPAGRWR